MHFTIEKIENQLREIRKTIHRQTCPIEAFRFLQGPEAEAQRGAEHPDFDDSAWPLFRVGEFWGGYDVTAWFRAWVQVPSGWENSRLGLHLVVGPPDGGGSTAESLLYVNGDLLQGIDAWHSEAWLPPEHLQAGRIHVAVKAWSGVLEVPEQRRFKKAELALIDPGAEQFYYLAHTLLQAAKELEPGDLRRLKLLQALEAAFSRVNFLKPRSQAYYDSLCEAEAVLRARKAALQACGEIRPKVIGIGHAHIDMAWLWRLKHTREKAAHTFTTALHLMRQYPEYYFLHSSPQLYKFLKEDYPLLFERVKEKIAEGRWEITGGMWVEADTNLTSGESLVRQFLFGKRYVRREFGREMNVLWLPDVFGYSGALPQIIRKSGLKSFITTKISWNQYNRFPYDTFRWRGIDGTEVLAHFVTTPEKGRHEHTYNGQLTPDQVRGVWEQYQQKEINSELLTIYGWGDGGGGPTREMLESARALDCLPGFPALELGKVEPYMERLEANLEGQPLPVWDGELYFEYHRGTYTSQAYVKRANRKAEFLYHNAEWLSALAAILAGKAYPRELLNANWERILLNQFHDILPGSSIGPVYEDARKEYEQIFRAGEAVVEGACSALAEGLSPVEGCLLVLNPLGRAQAGLVSVPYAAPLEGLRPAGGSPVQVVDEGGERRLLFLAGETPALGYTLHPLVLESGAKEQPEELVVRPDLLENHYYRLRLNEAGQLCSVYDKLRDREVLAPGGLGNLLQAFEDKPMKFDAWDIDIYYQAKKTEIDDLIEAVVEESGPLRGVLRLKWRFADSTITQRLTIYSRSPRIDFRTEIDWREQQVLLKAAFPVEVRTTRATYDIQFGCLERPTHWNTSWDWARFEVPAHKWADLSEGDYGVALLNDCKYGYDIKDNVMRLTLIKSAIYPDERADQGRHEFTYSLLPHAGDWRSGGVIEEAYALNNPLAAVFIPGRGEAGRAGCLPERYSFASGDADNVILETVKQAEEGEAWIVRLYESRGCRKNRVTLRFGQALSRADECDLMEENDRPASWQGDRLEFSIRPFEIKTFKVRF